MTNMQNQKKSFMNQTVLNPNQVMDLLNSGMELLVTVKEMCESTFVEFDLNGIWFGLSLNVVHISLMVILSWDKVNLRSVVNPKLLLSLPLTFTLVAMPSYFIHQVYMFLID